MGVPVQPGTHDRRGYDRGAEGDHRRAVARIAAVLILFTSGCGSRSPLPVEEPVEIGGGSTSAPTPLTSTTAAVATTIASDGSPIDVALRIERRVGDVATVGFEAFAVATLSDPRGWGRAGFRFRPDASAPFTLILAEGAVVDALCRPLETHGRYSCQNGPVVALNADRWRQATTKWTGSLDDYRRYLVNHEVGHLLGMRHPAVQCPAAGAVAPIMNQQSTELDGCLPNPWPLPEEVTLAARRPPNLAPPPDPD